MMLHNQKHTNERKYFHLPETLVQITPSHCTPQLSLNSRWMVMTGHGNYVIVFRPAALMETRSH